MLIWSGGSSISFVGSLHEGQRLDTVFRYYYLFCYFPVRFVFGSDFVFHLDIMITNAGRKLGRRGRWESSPDSWKFRRAEQYGSSLVYLCVLLYCLSLGWLHAPIHLARAFVTTFAFPANQVKLSSNLGVLQTAWLIYFVKRWKILLPLHGRFWYWWNTHKFDF